MKTELYADTVDSLPLLTVDSETLTDGSKVWNLFWRDLVIPCFSEKHAREALLHIGAALKHATAENIVIN